MSNGESAVHFIALLKVNLTRVRAYSLRWYVVNEIWWHISILVVLHDTAIDRFNHTFT